MLVLDLRTFSNQGKNCLVGKGPPEKDSGTLAHWNIGQSGTELYR